jgi:DNA-binding LacI/PurR family transcriptional regulator
MVRLKDIALRAGVSMMTVSKAMRDERDVSAATKARIRQLAESMGYVPDTAARGLRNNSTRLFGVLISSITNPIFTRIVAAIEHQAFERGYEIVLLNSGNDPAREEHCLRRLFSRRVDGLFLSPAYRMENEARIYQTLVTRGTPTILLGHPAPFCASFPFVTTDDLVSSYQATQHLLKLGHRKIAFLTGKPHAPWAAERFEGYRRALREAGIELDERLVYAAGSTMEDGVKAATQFINENCKATAIQAVNDMVAVGCGSTLLQQGVRIPEDVSLMGFGNVLVAEHFRVPLSTIRQAKYRLGVAASDMMLKFLKGERPESRRIPAELVVRQSTAAPGKRH